VALELFQHKVSALFIAKECKSGPGEGESGFEVYNFFLV